MSHRITRSLAEANPALTSEWHPVKNIPLTPHDIPYGTRKKYWWQCPKNALHSWEASPKRRQKTCPLCNVLAVIHPKLSKEWHPSKNACLNLTPETIKAGSGTEVWWICPKNSTHEWLMKVSQRSQGQGCPFCAGKRVALESCLATKNPELSKEWHPTKNGTLTPFDILPGSGRTMWWRCTKNNNHEWEAKVGNRHHRKSRCPYCFGNTKLGHGRDLAAKHPGLCREWHPTKNGVLIPSKVFYGSQKLVWWYCTKNKEHEWQAPILTRTTGHGCPYCSGRRTTPERSLAVLKPDIAKEWHPTKNGDLTPSDVSFGSAKKAWWQCLRNPAHEWELKICQRSGRENRKGSNCPECYQQASEAENRLSAELELIFPDLIQRNKIDGQEADIYIAKLDLIIEVDGAYWHEETKNKNRDKQKNKKWSENRRVVMRLRGHGLPKISENELSFDCGNIKLKDVKSVLDKILEIFRDTGKLTSQIKDKISWYKDQKKFYNIESFHLKKTSLLGTENKKSLKDERPDLVKEWHPTKNNGAVPEAYTKFSGKLVWWQCENGHEFEAEIIRRNNGQSCSICKSLAFSNSTLAKEWHPTKNGDLTPVDISFGSNKNVWWLCSKDHEWDASPDKRNRGKAGCPYCINRRVSIENCLATINPALAVEWHHTKNKQTPYDFTAGSKKYQWWTCSKNTEHEWEASIQSRNKGNGCPICSGKKIHLSNCLATTHPNLAKEWHPTKNGSLTPYSVTRGSKKKVHWICPKDHEHSSVILSRSHGHGCSECARKIKSETAYKRWNKYREGILE